MHNNFITACLYANGRVCVVSRVQRWRGCDNLHEAEVPEVREHDSQSCANIRRWMPLEISRQHHMYANVSLKPHHRHLYYRHYHRSSSSSSSSRSDWQGLRRCSGRFCCTSLTLQDNRRIPGNLIRRCFFRGQNAAVYVFCWSFPLSLIELPLRFTARLLVTVRTKSEIAQTVRFWRSLIRVASLYER